MGQVEEPDSVRELLEKLSNDVRSVLANQAGQAAFALELASMRQAYQDSERIQDRGLSWLRGRHDQLVHERYELEADLARAQQRISHLKDDLSAARKEAKLSAARAKHLEAEVSRRDGQLAALERELAEERRRSGAVPTAEAIAAEVVKRSGAGLTVEAIAAEVAKRLQTQQAEAAAVQAAAAASAQSAASRAAVAAGPGASGAAKAAASGAQAGTAAAKGSATGAAKGAAAGAKAPPAASTPSDVNKPDANGNLPLYSAVTAKDPERVRQLLRSGANPAARLTRCGCTALHLAAHKGMLEICRALLEAGAPVDALNNDGETPLHMATLATRGHAHDVVARLLAANAAVDVKDKEGNTPLLNAVQHGKPGVVRLLLDAGAPMYDTTKSGKTVMDLAEARGNQRVLEELLAADYDEEEAQAVELRKHIPWPPEVAMAYGDYFR